MSWSSRFVKEFSIISGTIVTCNSYQAYWLVTTGELRIHMEDSGCHSAEQPKYKIASFVVQDGSTFMSTFISTVASLVAWDAASLLQLPWSLHQSLISAYFLLLFIYYLCIYLLSSVHSSENSHGVDGLRSLSLGLVWQHLCWLLAISELFSLCESTHSSNTSILKCLCSHLGLTLKFRVIYVNY